MVMRQKSWPKLQARAHAGWGAPVILWLGSLLTVPACHEIEGPKPGAPVMSAFDVVDPTGMPVVLTADGGAALVSPRVQFVARFDRLLDGDLLEDVSDAGVTGKAGVAVISGGVGGASPQASVVYIPNGDADFKLLFAPGPQLVITPVPTLPSGSTVTITLDKARFRSKGGQGPYQPAAGVADVLTFTTEPFAASISAGDAAAATPPSADAGADAGAAASLMPSAPITVAFSNLPQDGVASHITVLVIDATGQPVPDAAAAAMPSEMDPALWVVAPKAAGWPAGAAVTITVDAATKDALGMPIAAAAVAAFTVAP
jgi:hypothetical protein